MATGHDNQPTLPEIFPQENVEVKDEQHRYETFEGQSNSVIEKTEYILDKAPIDEILDVTGVVDGVTTTFEKGVDYQLAELIRNKEDNFTFEDTQDDYVLDDEPDAGSTQIVDSSGDTYDSGTDYGITDTNSIEQGTITWLDGGSSPEDGEDFTVTYTVTYENSVIKWDDTETTPDAGSFFYVTYRGDSVMGRYVDSGTHQLDKIQHRLTDVINTKFVDEATGQELDEMGKIFGVLGKRSGRDDDQYRVYLKSVVQSFVSRGTINGIKVAISAATDVPIEDITINEDFEENEYDVEVIPNTPVTGSLLEEVADIADPSGVAQSGTTFTLDPEIVEVGDSVSFTLGELISEDMGVTDATASTRVDYFDTMVGDDSVDIDPNTFGPFADEMFADDDFAIDPNQFSTSDEITVADVASANRAEASDALGLSDAFAIDPRTFTTTDTISIDDPTAIPRGEVNEDVETAETLNVEPVNKNAHEWEETSEPEITTRWNFFEWTEITDVLIELTEAESDELSVDDTATVPAKDAIVSETGGSADSVNVRFNVQSITDTAFTDDAVTLPSAETTVDTGGSDDSVTNVSQTLVAWDTRDWNSLEWVQEHN